MHIHDKSETIWEPFGSHWAPIWKHLGALGSIRVHLAHLGGIFHAYLRQICDHLGAIGGSTWGHLGTFLGAILDHFGGLEVIFESKRSVAFKT